MSRTFFYGWSLFGNEFKDNITKKVISAKAIFLHIDWNSNHQETEIHSLNVTILSYIVPIHKIMKKRVHYSFRRSITHFRCFSHSIHLIQFAFLFHSRGKYLNSLFLRQSITTIRCDRRTSYRDVHQGCDIQLHLGKRHRSLSPV
jgi:hypothetical protein